MGGTLRMKLLKCRQYSDLSGRYAEQSPAVKARTKEIPAPVRTRLPLTRMEEVISPRSTMVTKVFATFQGGGNR